MTRVHNDHGTASLGITAFSVASTALLSQTIRYTTAAQSPQAHVRKCFFVFTAHIYVFFKIITFFYFNNV